MSAEPLVPRKERRAAMIAEQRAAREKAREKVAQGPSRGRTLAFGAIVVAVLLVGGYLAFGDFAGQRETTTTANAIPVRLSMAGFTPGEIKLKAGQAASLELWTTDAAPHLQNGVHTMISDELGIHEELPAAGVNGESRKVVTVTAPMTPGTYDIYCDTCCGGKASPTMHGKLVVEA